MNRESIVISGSGLYLPPAVISNKELITSFNQYVEHYNQKHGQKIVAGILEALKPSSAEFIENASGIQQRHVVEKEGILDIEWMCPRLPERSPQEISYQAEMGVFAAKNALQHAAKTPKQLDAVIVACSNYQRPYPAISIEIQQALGIEGFALDLNMACSSIPFGIGVANGLIQAEQCQTVLLITPEIYTGHLNFRDRDSHFIFGDAATALVIEKKSQSVSPQQMKIQSLVLKTNFSNNIRNDGGFFNRSCPTTQEDSKLFTQKGNTVFKDIVLWVPEIILCQLKQQPSILQEVKQLWLHQANQKMNVLIGKKILGRVATKQELPFVLSECANTGAAGAAIVLHQYGWNLQVGEIGILCGFGAGYSMGSVLLKKC